MFIIGLKWGIKGLIMKPEIIQTNETWTVAVDADGVLADFEGPICKHLGLKDRALLKERQYRKRLWGTVDYINEHVHPFFENLEKMPDADELMDFVRGNFINHFILTACGSTPPNAAAQKRTWFKRQYGHGLHVKTVQDSVQKARYAGPTVILIDDRMKSIGPWVEAGGIGILHKNAKDTIRQLREILNGGQPDAY